ncbi:MAG: putative glycoside hydrolase family 47 protein [Streblomastix strix]|uniref:mannosyl-oligosaccharide 1,2-alpha-mannosidase n=2 Tax=Streblomastix strix TaxID=222440 RepID=A0A5J4WKX0_9EUKA|nr:MAG: putative glycoside hydrolase family 47 protein [Streblomastix strix]
MVILGNISAALLEEILHQHNSLEIEKRLSVLFSFGANVTETCAQMYLSNNVTGLGSENVEFGASVMNDDGIEGNLFRSGSGVMNNNNYKEIDNKRMNNNIQQQDEQSNMNKEQQQQTPSNDDILPFWKRGNSSYILRPEVVESIFYLYRITGDKRYKDMNWQIFRNIEKHSRCPPRILTADGDEVENITVSQSFNDNNIINQPMDQIKNEQNDDQQCIGYTTLSSINQQDSIRRMNEMPSFFFAETLKYIYLTFTDANEVVPLDEWVFTTEAHPILRRARLAVEKFW